MPRESGAAVATANERHALEIKRVEDIGECAVHLAFKLTAASHAFELQRTSRFLAIFRIVVAHALGHAAASHKLTAVGVGAGPGTIRRLVAGATRVEADSAGVVRTIFGRTAVMRREAAVGIIVVQIHAACVGIAVRCQS